MEMRKAKVAVLLVGWAFLVTGIVGLFLPFLQGILFIFIGLAILSSRYLWADKILTKAKKRYPKLADQLDGILLKMRKRS
jgi:uncharacterized membrane protein YbaN (DUF454 family)